jgi:HPt (histidine-containing phosphotransfer) domain-containing protein
MDDYISKPVKVEALAAMLERWVRAEGERVEPTARDSFSDELFANMRKLAGNVNPKLLIEVMEVFLKDAPARLDAMRAALAAADARAIGKAAHALKGGCAYVGATRMYDLCNKLEDQGIAGTLDLMEAELSELEKEFGRVRRAMEHEIASVK